ncbi:MULTISPECIES: glycolate oxidase subunit GlcF [unclassified Sphingomonas]|nr:MULTISPECIES: glycolate oxidase subunit GlcF [unclassified Sphingomonas]KQX18830.1 2-hydroxy-acid oxidase [Sphingomonas sp. Root1294]KQY72350.1 2-hydroxy-acid oxidase [Sphingomonas sp. Root50]KRB95507.1 2-hydroxy-acid oxidase [Sphingomonas sp. Root720]
MRTDFSPEQLADPATAVAEAVIRKCVHCGFCTATCPTYVLLGDELDSPRGRIYLIQNMLERDAIPTPQVVKHVDRCLSCLSCMTTCPSGVNYMHLVDHARAYIERRYRRPLAERLIRGLLAAVLPHPGRFRVALALARLVRPTAPLLARVGWAKPLAAMLRMAPRRATASATRETPRPAAPIGRIALLQGCAEPVLKPAIRAATIRLLARLGYQVVLAPGEQCCGALVHHMGREAAALGAARRNVDAWSRQIDEGGLDAILITASGCGTTIKDYGFLLRDDPAYAARAARVSALAKDISEFLDTLDLPPGDGRGLTVAYHPACSLQHGQGIAEAPKRLLAHMGYRVKTPAEAHLCCGSAGTYNILQPELAGKLGDRKAAAIDRLGADIIATGNIGCAMQIGARSATPIAHIVELLDWASGGPAPGGLSPAAAPEEA